MLNSTELDAYCVRRNLSQTARGIVVSIRRAPPSRRVRSGITNVPCRYASRKMGCTIQAESHRNELAAVISWEFDCKTFEFYDQPPKIPLRYQDATGRRRGHLMTPDFFVLQENFTGWVECKTEEWLKKRAEEGSPLYVPDGAGGWRCPPGDEHAASVGLGFRVRSSLETNWTAVRNAEFLSDYLDERMPPVTQKQVSAAADLFSSQAWMKLKELLEADPHLTGDAIYTMIAGGQLHVDLGRDLLAQPERTLVFRDAVAANAYRATIESSQLPAVPDLKAVKVEAGQSLIWDGRLIRILNVGDNDVFLEDESRAIVPIRRSDLDALVQKGAVTGLPANTDTKWNQVEEAFRQTSPEGFAGALKRYYSIFPERAESPQIVGGKRVQRKWRRLYRLAAERTGFGLIGLLPRIHLRGNRERKLDEAVIKIMNDVIDEIYAKSGKRTLLRCWGEARNRCLEAGFAPPGERAFRNQVARRNKYDLVVAREGEKAAYDIEEFQWYLEQTSPRHGERPFEIAHIDHTELDLQFVGARHGEPLGKAWLTVMIDGFTRMAITWTLRFEEPSYRSCMAVIRECVRRHGRVAKTIVVDNGSDFESTYFETLLAHLEVTKKSRPGGKPRFGSIIERLFGVTNQEFIHNLAGNNQALQNPRRMSPSHDPRRLAIWTLAHFMEAFQGYLDRVYHEAEHRALGLSPKRMLEVGLAQYGMREHKLIPYSQNFAVLCMPSTPKGTAKIEAARGVKINYLHYWTPDFRDPSLAGKEVPVRYDPDDASVAFAWLRNSWVPCRSEHAAEFQGCSEKEIQIATQELRARLKRDGVRRAATGSLLADYMRSTEVTEKLLLQRKRHRETAAARNDEIKSLLGIPELNQRPTDQETAWTELPLEIYGEFK